MTLYREANTKKRPSSISDFCDYKYKRNWPARSAPSTIDQGHGDLTKSIWYIDQSFMKRIGQKCTQHDWPSVWRSPSRRSGGAGCKSSPVCPLPSFPYTFLIKMQFEFLLRPNQRGAFCWLYKICKTPKGDCNHSDILFKNSKGLT